MPTTTAKPKKIKAPAAKKSTVTKSKRSSAPEKKQEEAAPAPAVIRTSGICRTCSALPVGSAEITTLLLVLVFSLSAVLFTAVTTINAQHQHIQQLEYQAGIHS